MKDNTVDQDQILGDWISGNGSLKMNIYKASDGEFRGKIIWTRDDDFEDGRPLVDGLNPDLALRERPIVGLEFITGLKFYPRKQEWKDGHVYDPEEGKTYHLKVWLENETTLNLRGSIDSLSMLGETYSWHRIID
jgi:uncharacterized protein (DUF2147 family)